METLLDYGSYRGISKIISGGQTGSDEAGLHVAQRFNVRTGGFAPKGFRTSKGSNQDLKDLFALEETESRSYFKRTYLNVKHSDGTIRLATNFLSSGEILTKAYCEKENKPYFDVNLKDPIPVKYTIGWLTEHKIEVLNVAGNRDINDDSHFLKAAEYLDELLYELNKAGLLQRIKI